MRKKISKRKTHAKIGDVINYDLSNIENLPGTKALQRFWNDMLEWTGRKEIMVSEIKVSNKVWDALMGRLIKEMNGKKLTNQLFVALNSGPSVGEDLKGTEVKYVGGSK